MAKVIEQVRKALDASEFVGVNRHHLPWDISHYENLAKPEVQKAVNISVYEESVGRLYEPGFYMALLGVLGGVIEFVDEEPK